MKNIFNILLLTFIFLSNTTISQHRCSTMDHHEYLKQTRPNYSRAIEKMNLQQSSFISKNPKGKTSRAIVNIPVVVHVIYGNSTENISDAQVLSQIEVLNEDFSLTNSEVPNIPSPFASVASNTEIQFCLATTDPNGNPTDGINRVSTNVSSFSINGDDMKFTSSGGADAWDVANYFNIWVCDLGGGLLGYAEFPTNSYSNTYGVVIGYNYFGRVGNLSPTYNKGRTTTHEIGHALSLYHIWGDSFCGDDQVADTPVQEDANYGASFYPHNANNSCGAGPNGEMFMNYMDYGDDAYLYMFTEGQAVRMNSVLSNSIYSSLTNSTVSCSGGTGNTNNANDVGITQIVSPEDGANCVDIVEPEVIIQNFGTDQITSFQVLVSVDGGTPIAYNVNGVLNQGESGSLTLDPLNLNAGLHTIVISTSLPNGSADDEPLNDSQTITVTTGSVGQPLPFNENFSSSTFPPAGWAIVNSDGDLTWIRENTSPTGSGSASVTNYDYQVQSAEADELITPGLDFGNSSATLKFDLAYQMYQSNGSSFTDELQVYASGDCGETWSLVYQKSGNDLVTASVISSQTPFTPSSVADWRTETVDLSAAANQGVVKVKFTNLCSYANNLYIDNINITSSAFISSTDQIGFNGGLSEINLFPNPTSNILNINSQEDISKYEIYSVYGQKIIENTLNQKFIEISTDKLSSGTYFIQLTSAKSGEKVAVKFLKK